VQTSRYEAILRSLPPHISNALITLIEATEYRLLYYKQDVNIVSKIAEAMLNGIDKFCEENNIDDITDIQVIAACLVVIIDMLEQGARELERKRNIEGRFNYIQ